MYYDGTLFIIQIRSFLQSLETIDWSFSARFGRSTFLPAFFFTFTNIVIVRFLDWCKISQLSSSTSKPPRDPDLKNNNQTKNHSSLK